MVEALTFKIYSVHPCSGWPLLMGRGRIQTLSEWPEHSAGWGSELTLEGRLSQYWLWHWVLGNLPPLSSHTAAPQHWPNWTLSWLLGSWVSSFNVPYLLSCPLPRHRISQSMHSVKCSPLGDIQVSPSLPSVELSGISSQGVVPGAGPFLLGSGSVVVAYPTTLAQDCNSFHTESGADVIQECCSWNRDINSGENCERTEIVNPNQGLD